MCFVSGIEQLGEKCSEAQQGPLPGRSRPGTSAGPPRLPIPGEEAVAQRTGQQTVPSKARDPEGPKSH